MECRPPVLGWAFRPRNFMKNGGACFSLPAGRKAGLHPDGFSPLSSLAEARTFDRPRKAMVCPTSLLRAVFEGLVGFGAFARLPIQRIVFATVARPGVERVDHVLRSEEHTSELQSLRHLVC